MIGTIPRKKDMIFNEKTVNNRFFKKNNIILKAYLFRMW